MYLTVPRTVLGYPLSCGGRGFPRGDGRRAGTAAALADEHLRGEIATAERTWQLQIEKAEYEARRAEQEGLLAARPASGHPA